MTRDNKARKPHPAQEQTRRDASNTPGGGLAPQRSDERIADSMSAPEGTAAGPGRGDGDTTPEAEGGPALQGEGNYTAARRHRESAERFVAEGRVDEAAREAEPESRQEAEELEDAEERGREPARR